MTGEPVGVFDTGVPRIFRVTYQNPALFVAWTMSGVGPSTAFQVAVKNQQTGQTTNFPATGNTATIQQDLTVGTPYEVAVAAIIDGTPGPASAPVPIITTAPVVTRVANTGTGLQLAWSALSGYTTYTAVLQNPEKSLSQMVQALTCTFDTPLSGTGYTTGVAAQSSDGISVGPIGQAYTPLLVAPKLFRIQNTGSGLALLWGPVTGFSKYLATLQETGQAANTQEVTGTAFTFAGALTGSAYVTYVAVQDGQWHQLAVTLVRFGSSSYSVAIYRDGVRLWYAQQGLAGAAALQTGAALVLAQGISGEPGLPGS